MSHEPNPASSHRKARLDAGLYLVATPIGTARDITLRALDVLANADAIAAEDTRTARKLMEIHGVALAGRPLIAYHDHSGPETRSRISRLISEGQSVAYVSEAGTPLVADPGYQLGRSVIGEGGPVQAVPGPSAALAALTVSGLPSDRFLFAGFPPSSGGARQSWLEELAEIKATLILYESPRRVKKLLDLMSAVFGAERQIALCRELTKRFEEVLRGSISQITEAIEERELKGEIVLVVDRGEERELGEEEIKARLLNALETRSVKTASSELAAELGLPKRKLYQMALQLEADRK